MTGLETLVDGWWVVGAPPGRATTRTVRIRRAPQTEVSLALPGAALESGSVEILASRLQVSRRLARKVSRARGPDTTSAADRRERQEGLFALALAVTRHPELTPRSRERYLRRWLRLPSPGARAAWVALATNANFWARLDDRLRDRVARLLRRGSGDATVLRQRVERLMVSPAFVTGDSAGRWRALSGLGC